MEEDVTADDIEAEDFKHLQLELDDAGIAWLTVNRPKALNALNGEVIEELRLAFLELTQDEEVRAVVLLGAGDRAFVAGADISEFVGMSPLEARALSMNGQDMLAVVESSPIPVIAMIQGFALGGGLELALACHLRVASEDAQLGLPEVGLGLIPGFGGTQRLARLAGPGVAREWILTGDRFPAQEAWRVGVVHRVVPAASLREETAKLAGTIAKRGPVAVAKALEVIRRGLEVGQTEGENLEADAFGLLFATADQSEGAEAFLEKRKPDFRGE